MYDYTIIVNADASAVTQQIISAYAKAEAVVKGKTVTIKAQLDPSQVDLIMSKLREQKIDVKLNLPSGEVAKISSQVSGALDNIPVTVDMKDVEKSLDKAKAYAEKTFKGMKFDSKDLFGDISTAMKDTTKTASELMGMVERLNTGLKSLGGMDSSKVAKMTLGQAQKAIASAGLESFRAFDMYLAQGQEELVKTLKTFTQVELHQIIKSEDLDSANRFRNVKNIDKLINHIVEKTKERSTQADAFRDYNGDSSIRVGESRARIKPEDRHVSNDDYIKTLKAMRQQDERDKKRRSELKENIKKILENPTFSIPKGKKITTDQLRNLGTISYDLATEYLDSLNASQLREMYDAGELGKTRATSKKTLMRLLSEFANPHTLEFADENIYESTILGALHSLEKDFPISTTEQIKEQTDALEENSSAVVNNTGVKKQQIDTIKKQASSQGSDTKEIRENTAALNQNAKAREKVIKVQKTQNGNGTTSQSSRTIEPELVYTKENVGFSIPKGVVLGSSERRYLTRISEEMLEEYLTGLTVDQLKEMSKEELVRGRSSLKTKKAYVDALKQRLINTTNGDVFQYGSDDVLDEDGKKIGLDYSKRNQYLKDANDRLTALYPKKQTEEIKEGTSALKTQTDKTKESIEVDKKKVRQTEEVSKSLEKEKEKLEEVAEAQGKVTAAKKEQIDVSSQGQKQAKIQEASGTHKNDKTREQMELMPRQELVKYAKSVDSSIDTQASTEDLIKQIEKYGSNGNPILSQEELWKKTVPALKEIAKGIGVSYNSKTKKGDLIEAIVKKNSEGTTGSTTQPTTSVSAEKANKALEENTDAINDATATQKKQTEKIVKTAEKGTETTTPSTKTETVKKDIAHRLRDVVAESIPYDFFVSEYTDAKKGTKFNIKALVDGYKHFLSTEFNEITEATTDAELKIFAEGLKDKIEDSSSIMYKNDGTPQTGWGTRDSGLYSDLGRYTPSQDQIPAAEATEIQKKQTAAIKEVTNAQEEYSAQLGDTTEKVEEATKVQQGQETSLLRPGKEYRRLEYTKDTAGFAIPKGVELKHEDLYDLALTSEELLKEYFSNINQKQLEKLAREYFGYKDADFLEIENLPEFITGHYLQRARQGEVFSIFDKWDDQSSFNYATINKEVRLANDRLSKRFPNPNPVSPLPDINEGIEEILIERKKQSEEAVKLAEQFEKETNEYNSKIHGLLDGIEETPTFSIPIGTELSFEQMKALGQVSEKLLNNYLHTLDEGTIKKYVSDGMFKGINSTSLDYLANGVREYIIMKTPHMFSPKETYESFKNALGLLEKDFPLVQNPDSSQYLSISSWTRPERKIEEELLKFTKDTVDFSIPQGKVLDYSDLLDVGRASEEVLSDYLNNLSLEQLQTIAKDSGMEFEVEEGSGDVLTQEDYSKFLSSKIIFRTTHGDIFGGFGDYGKNDYTRVNKRIREANARLAAKYPKATQSQVPAIEKTTEALEKESEKLDEVTEKQKAQSAEAEKSTIIHKEEAKEIAKVTEAQEEQVKVESTAPAKVPISDLNPLQIFATQGEEALRKTLATYSAKELHALMKQNLYDPEKQFTRVRNIQKLVDAIVPKVQASYTSGTGYKNAVATLGATAPTTEETTPTTTETPITPTVVDKTEVQADSSTVEAPSVEIAGNPSVEVEAKDINVTPTSGSELGFEELSVEAFEALSEEEQEKYIDKISELSDEQLAVKLLDKYGYELVDEDGNVTELITEETSVIEGSTAAINENTDAKIRNAEASETQANKITEATDAQKEQAKLTPTVPLKNLNLVDVLATQGLDGLKQTLSSYSVKDLHSFMIDNGYDPERQYIKARSIGKLVDAIVPQVQSRYERQQALAAFTQADKLVYTRDTAGFQIPKKTKLDSSSLTQLASVSPEVLGDYLTGLNMNQLKDISKERDFNIAKSLKKSQYVDALSSKLVEQATNEMFEKGAENYNNLIQSYRDKFVTAYPLPAQKKKGKTQETSIEATKEQTKVEEKQQEVTQNSTPVLVQETETIANQTEAIKENTAARKENIGAQEAQAKIEAKTSSKKLIASTVPELAETEAEMRDALSKLNKETLLKFGKANSLGEFQGVKADLINEMIGYLYGEDGKLLSLTDRIFNASMKTTFESLIERSKDSSLYDYSGSVEHSLESFQKAETLLEEIFNFPLKYELDAMPGDLADAEDDVQGAAVMHFLSMRKNGLDTAFLQKKFYSNLIRYYDDELGIEDGSLDLLDLDDLKKNLLDKFGIGKSGFNKASQIIQAGYSIGDASDYQFEDKNSTVDAINRFFNVLNGDEELNDREYDLMSMKSALGFERLLALSNNDINSLTSLLSLEDLEILTNSIKSYRESSALYSAVASDINPNYREKKMSIDMARLKAAIPVEVKEPIKIETQKEPVVQVPETKPEDTTPSQEENIPVAKPITAPKEETPTTTIETPNVEISGSPEVKVENKPTTPQLTEKEKYDQMSQTEQMNYVRQLATTLSGDELTGRLASLGVSLGGLTPKQADEFIELSKQQYEALSEDAQMDYITKLYENRSKEEADRIVAQLGYGGLGTSVDETPTIEANKVEVTGSPKVEVDSTKAPATVQAENIGISGKSNTITVDSGKVGSETTTETTTPPAQDIVPANEVSAVNNELSQTVSLLGQVSGSLETVNGEISDSNSNLNQVLSPGGPTPPGDNTTSTTIIPPSTTNTLETTPPIQIPEVKVTPSDDDEKDINFATDETSFILTDYKGPIVRDLGSGRSNIAYVEATDSEGNTVLIPSKNVQSTSVTSNTPLYSQGYLSGTNFVLPDYNILETSVDRNNRMPLISGIEGDTFGLVNYIAPSRNQHISTRNIQTATDSVSGISDFYNQLSEFILSTGVNAPQMTRPLSNIRAFMTGTSKDIATFGASVWKVENALTSVGVNPSTTQVGSLREYLNNSGIYTTDLTGKQYIARGGYNVIENGAFLTVQDQERYFNAWQGRTIEKMIEPIITETGKGVIRNGVVTLSTTKAPVIKSDKISLGEYAWKQELNYGGVFGEENTSRLALPGPVLGSADKKQVVLANETSSNLTSASNDLTATVNKIDDVISPYARPYWSNWDLNSGGNYLAPYSGNLFNFGGSSGSGGGGGHSGNKTSSSNGSSGNNIVPWTKPIDFSESVETNTQSEDYDGKNPLDSKFLKSYVSKMNSYWKEKAKSEANPNDYNTEFQASYILEQLKPMQDALDARLNAVSNREDAIPLTDLEYKTLNARESIMKGTYVESAKEAMNYSKIQSMRNRISDLKLQDVVPQHLAQASETLSFMDSQLEETFKMMYETANPTIEQMEDMKDSATRYGEELYKEYYQQTRSRMNIGVNEARKAQIGSNFETWLARNGKTANVYKDEIEQIRTAYGNADSQGLMDRVQNQMYTLRQTAEREGNTGLSFTQQIGKIASRAGSYLASYASIYRVIGALKQGVSVVSDLDKAYMTLRQVSTESTGTLKGFQKESFGMADAVGTSAVQIQQSTADWLRLGKSFDQAKEFASLSTKLLNVSEYTSINDATSALVSATQAYQDVDANDIVDKLNYVGNNFAINTSDLASGIANAGGVLAQQGNSLEESIALITAGKLIA